MNFDVTRANLSNKAKFKPFQVSNFLDAVMLKKNNSIKPDEGVLVFEFNKEYFGFLTKQMAYHHVANGNINGEPFMISF